MRCGLHDAMQEILREREKQELRKGWTLAHDDTHTQGEMALAAALYALPYQSLEQEDHIALDMKASLEFGWTIKPEPDPRRRLVKAAALILAEIERLDRATRHAPVGSRLPA